MAMKNKIILILVLTLMCACASHRRPIAGDHVLRGAVISSVVVPQVLSGVIATFVEIKVKQNQGDLVFLYPYLDVGQVMPGIGDHCDLYYTQHPIEGHTADRTLGGEIAKVVSTFDCREPTQ